MVSESICPIRIETQIFTTLCIITDRPIQYLYNTLHFYERKLRNRPPSKKRLVAAVCGALSDMRPTNWALTEQYQLYIQMADAEATLWNPELSYYISIMRRFIDSKYFCWVVKIKHSLAVHLSHTEIAESFDYSKKNFPFSYSN